MLLKALVSVLQHTVIFNAHQAVQEHSLQSPGLVPQSGQSCSLYLLYKLLCTPLPI